MKYCQLWDSVSNLHSKQGSIESQILFGERILQGNSFQYAYSQLLHANTYWRPYPGKIRDTQLIPISNYFQPNAVICSYTAVLEPWNIPIPYASPVCIKKNGELQLPIEIINYIPSKSSNKIKINPKSVRFLSKNFCISSLCINALQNLY